MISILIGAGLICAASWLVGAAIVALAAGRGPVGRWIAPSVGLAALMVAAVAGSRAADGEGAAVGMGAVVIAALAALALRRRGLGALPLEAGRPSLVRAAIVASLVSGAVLAAALPFFIAGHAGVLGVGLINDDMASHLQIAEHIRDPLPDPPRFVEGGYPIGPHALVAGLAEAPGIDLVEAFGAFTIALAPLLALTLLGGLGHLPGGRRALAALLAALSYLVAAYIGQGAFKEPLEAVIVIAFALYLTELVGLSDREPVVPGDRPAAWRAVPIGLLAAASTLNYSVPGLLWLLAVAFVILVARYYVIGPRPQSVRIAWRRLVPYVLAGLAIVVVATISEWGRIADFTRLDAFRPDRVGSDLGNLRQSISPAEALGIWPTGDFRTAAADAGPPAIVFWLGAAIAAALALAGGWVAWAARRVALLGALVATIAIWVAAELIATPYFAAKALAIGAPVVMAISLGWALVPGSRLRGLAAIALIAGAAASSFLALRTSPVGPSEHAAELDRIRPHVERSDVLFLGRDDFIGWELRGADVDGVVKNHFNVGRVPARFRNPNGSGDKFDIDAVTPKGVRRYDYVLATRGEPRSELTVPGLRLIERTPSYELFAVGSFGPRKTLGEGAEPGVVLRCDGRLGARKRSARAVVFPGRPAIIHPAGNRELAATDRSPAVISAELRSGTYDVSIAYDSRRPLRIEGELIDETVPANLDFRGPTPLLPAGRIDVVRPGTFEFSFSPEQPSWLARALGAPNEAHVRALGFSLVYGRAELPLRRACGRYVDYYIP